MNKKILYTIITIAVTILLILFIIIINKPANEQDEVPEEPAVIAHHNVFILSSEDGIIRYLEHGEHNTCTGSLDAEHADFTGFADILVYADNSFIEVTEYRTKCQTGRLLAYTDKQILLEGHDWIDFSEDLQVLKTYDNDLNLCELREFVVGATCLQFFTDEYGVCGLIQDTPTTTDDIRVVIKNDDTGEIYYNELYLYSVDSLLVNDEPMEAGKTFDVANYMRNNQFRSITISSASPIAITDENGKRKSAYYEGSLSIVNEDPTKAPNGDNIRLVLVNTLPIETYVRYVLPSEMPESFGFEAKKAQAVCARTYAYSQMKNGEYAPYGGNLDDSTMYQVYNAHGTTAATDKAASDTQGMVASCNDKLITCYYFSTSPGFTHGLEAWGEEDTEYLSFHNQTDNSYDDLTLSTNVRNALDDSLTSYDSDSPFYRWKATLDFSSKRIRSAADSELGSLKSFKITKRTDAGYVCGMEITYSNGTKELTSELEVRRFFGNFLGKLQLNNGSTRKDFKLLPCAFFVIDSQYESFTIKSLSGKKITLLGGGFGHGIGMSQYGANGMAASGKDYTEIINYYYDNVELKNVKELDAFK